MKILAFTILFSSILTGISAQHRSSDAILCSSIYYIVTSLMSDNNAGQEVLMQQQEIFNLIYTAKQNRVVSNGEVSELKHQHLMYLSDLYDQNPSKVYNIEMQCSNWREKFASSLMKLTKTANNFDQLKEGIRKFPAMSNEEFDNTNPRWEASKTMMDLSFENWSKNGRITPYSFKQNLSNSLKEKN